MDTKDHILKGLNDKQAEAVTTIDGPVLILAGAGSGKTKALTHRIAYMIASGIKSENILAVTFTNKAAQEMQERLRKLLGTRAIPMMGTFHSICARILRQDIERLGYLKNFLIYDSEDQQSLVKSVMQDLNIDPKRYNPKAILQRISKLKNEVVSAGQFNERATELMERTVASVYNLYQDALKKNNALDFDDLIMLPIVLFRKHPDVLAKYQDIFRYILVDEYQDTNHAQYTFINMLAEKHRNLFVIGDDYQSIYAWRQADIGNILNFEKDYPEVKTIMLEQNYRSTKNILLAAQQLIGKNVGQKHKNLWTENEIGEQIMLKELEDHRAEARYIVAQIEKYIHRGSSLSDFSILYRTHAQSRAIEEAMVAKGFPYRIIGGIKFYERREVKDILAYLRLAANPRDFISFERVYNVPERGIGKVTFEKIKTFVKDGGNIYQSIQSALAAGGFTTRQKDALGKLAGLLEKLHHESGRSTLMDLVTLIVKDTDYKTYIDDGTEEGEERWKNVREIFTAVGKYEEELPPDGLSKFLEEVSLIQDTDKLRDTTSEAISMMTLHSVKGLEFPIVFMVGLEEGVFPHSRALLSPKELEEERRLCYVGITRARKQLHITFCRQRMIHGATQFNPPSRFLLELPEELIDFSPLNSEYRDYIEY